jgi:type II restriction enzyme
VAESIKKLTNSSISTKDKEMIQKKLRDQGLYSERNPEMPLDSIDHKIRDLAFYMFGYRAKINNEKKFLFSPLGNLFLNNLNDKKKLKKIFFTMLWGMQFEHPESSTENGFQLYPYRLIFKLLNDERLDRKLYTHEIAYVVFFVKTMRIQEEYTSVVNKILELRSKSNQQITELFESNMHVLVNSVYEWDYYSSEVLSSAGVIKKTKGEIICKLPHGRATTRTLKNYYEINSNLLGLYNDLNSAYSFFNTPLSRSGFTKLQFDIDKEIYSFFPDELLRSIGESSEYIKKLEELLNLPKLIDQYSNNTDGKECYLFEDVLTDGFNMFYNIEAEKRGGAGKTDIECLFIHEPCNTKFAIDAKSTKNKLTSVNTGRLTSHREKIGGEYTIVIAPRYVPAVKHDIKDSKTVILLASTFSEYLYNCIESNMRKIDYSLFDEIITSNLGKDISEHISELTFKQFAGTTN